MEDCDGIVASVECPFAAAVVDEEAEAGVDWGRRTMGCERGLLPSLLVVVGCTDGCCVCWCCSLR